MARRKRVAFKPFSNAALNAGTVIHRDLKSFWSQNVAVRPRGAGQSRVARGDLPKEKQALVAYRDHAKHRPEHKENDARYGNPAHHFFLSTIFPGVHFTSMKRKEAIDKMLALVIGEREGVQPEHHFVVFKTEHTFLRLYFTNDKKCWWFVGREQTTLMTSLTFGSKDRALSVCEQQQIKWVKREVFEPDSS